MIKKINIKRIELLVAGEQPEGLCEELFVVAFKSGLSGETYMLTLLQVSDIFEGLSHDEKDYFTLGYAMGQKTHLESEDELATNMGLYTKRTTH